MKRKWDKRAERGTSSKRDKEKMRCEMWADEAKVRERTERHGEMNE